MKRTGCFLVGLLIVSAWVTAAAPNKELMTLFQDALYQEQTAGDLDKAIEMYQKVVADSGEIERLAAKATFQLGMCYLKKDDKTKAAEYFRKVVSDYPAQKELVANAKKQLKQARNVSPEELAKIVKDAVKTISTCAETDPKIKIATDSLTGLDPNRVITEICKYFDSDTDTIRRAAIYTLWKGGLPDITAAEAKLIELCSHTENTTRGMAALTLSSIKTPASLEAIKKMAEDADSYARRCAVYALGLYGDAAAIPLIEKALQDSDPLVKANAQTAMTMLTQPKDSAVKPAKPDKLRSEDLTAEGWKLWQERKLAEAEKKFEEAVAADATNDGAYQGLGWAQLNQGKKNNAKASFEKCVELTSDNIKGLVSFFKLIVPFNANDPGKNSLCQFIIVVSSNQF